MQIIMCGNQNSKSNKYNLCSGDNKNLFDASKKNFGHFSHYDYDSK